MTPRDSPSFDHLDRLSDHRGIFEHAEGAVRREEHGYCVDDNARLLVVASRQGDIGAAHRLSRLALRFVLDAQSTDGRCRNRMDRAGAWTDGFTVEDCWGRSVWGLGVAAIHHMNPTLRRSALRGFDAAVRQRSRWPRAMAFAALGAADVLSADPGHRAARALLVDSLAAIGTGNHRGDWVWPEPRLAYANAALAEAKIAAGAALGRDDDLAEGLTMLAWLLERETVAGHLSVTPVGGSGPGDRGPRFDQQPIEVAAMADACWRAHHVSGEPEWLRGVVAAAGWFNGVNDVGLPMFDARSGGGFDGLQVDSVNLNQGAESTLAFVSMMQRARSFVAVA